MPFDPKRQKKPSSKPQNGAGNLDKRESLLGDCSDCVVSCPDIKPALSNLSLVSSSIRHTDDDTNNPHAFNEYQKYFDSDSVRSTESSDTSRTQDTFSTTRGSRHPAMCGIVGKADSSSLMDWRMQWPREIVKSRLFKRVSIMLILTHCALCAAATYDFATASEEVKYRFNLAKDCFVYIMTLELLLQFLANGIRFFTNGWLVFDLVVVCSAWAVPTLLVVRTFRVVRTLRLASWVKDLKELVRALLLVIPKMFAIFFLLFILFIIFAILFTDLFKHTYEDGITEEDYFGGISRSLFTLFQIMTLDSWAEICKEIMLVHEWAWAPFIGFVVVSSFFFLNLVIAVVCEAVTSVHRDTVVKYIQEDISTAASVREAIKMDDRLDDLAGSVELMMKTQLLLLDALQMQQSQLGQLNFNSPSSSSSSPEKEMTEQEVTLQLQKEVLENQMRLRGGNRIPTKTIQTFEEQVDSSYEGSFTLNPPSPGQDNRILRQAYMSGMTVEAHKVHVPEWRHDETEEVELPSRRLFENEQPTGPFTPQFWQQTGLNEAQIRRVMMALQDPQYEQGP